MALGANRSVYKNSYSVAVSTTHFYFLSGNNGTLRFTPSMLKDSRFWDDAFNDNARNNNQFYSLKEVYVELP